jgi:hypothetical protein
MLNRYIYSASIMGTKTIRAILVYLIFTATLTVSSGLTLLMPIRVNLAAAQPSVAEDSAPGVKPNEYYIFTQELNANELTNIIVHK